MDEGLSVTGRRVVGYALRWRQEAPIRERGQRFIECVRRGAFGSSIAAGQVTLVIDHDRDLIVARQSNGTLHLIDDDNGLFVDAMIENTADGDDAIASVRCGYRRGLSVSFLGAVDHWRDGMRTVMRAELDHIGICRVPAYRSGQIVAGKSKIDRFLTEHGAATCRLDG